MRWELIDTLPNALVGGVATASGPTPYSDIVLVYIGKNQIGQSASLADITGTLTVKHAGSKSRRSLGQIVSLNRSQALLTMWENWRGRVVELSQDAGDLLYRGVMIIPFHLGLNGPDRNIVYSGPGEKLVLHIPPMDPAGAHLDPAEENIIEVYGILKHSGMSYCPRITDVPLTLGGNRKWPLPAHTAILVLGKHTTDPTEISVVRGSEIITEGSWIGHFFASQMYYHMDSNPYNATDLYLDFTDLGYDKSDALGDGQHIVVTGGTGTMQILTFSLDMEHAATQTLKSAEHYIEELSEKVATLTAEGIPPLQIGINLPEAAKFVPDIAKELLAEAKRRNVLPIQVPVSASAYNMMG